MTPLDKAILLMSAVDEDLANEAAMEIEEILSKLEKNFNDREKFFLKMCQIMKLSYEDTDEDELFAKLRALQSCYETFALGINREDE